MIKQYDLAAAKGVRWGILIGNEEISEGSVSLKNLESREVFLKIDIEQAVKIIKNSNRK